MKRRSRNDRSKRAKQQNRCQNDDRRRQTILAESDTTTSGTSALNDIEEQLRVQRIKKREQTSLRKNSNVVDEDGSYYLETDETIDETTTECDVTILGKYTYDPQRKAYFPTVINNNNNRHYCDMDVQHNNNTVNNKVSLGQHGVAPVTTTPTSTRLLPYRYMMSYTNTCETHQHQHSKQPSNTNIISYIVQLLHGTKQRRNLIATDWYGAKLLNSMSIIPITKSVSYITPMINGTDNATAMAFNNVTTVTSRSIARQTTTTTTTNNNNSNNNNHQGGNNIGSALWTRTFEIVPSQNHTINAAVYDNDDSRYCDSDNNNNNNKDIVQCFSYTYPFIHGKMIRQYNTNTASDRSPECIVGCLQPLIRRKTNLHILDHIRQSSFSMLIKYECNDFTAPAVHGTSSIVPRIVVGGNSSYTSIVDLVREAVIEDRRRFHTVSDILCIESSDTQSSNSGTNSTMDDGTTISRPELVFFGHRNGLIQVHDLRTNIVQPIGKLTGSKNHHMTTHNKKNIENVDSVLRIQPLFRERPDQVVARGRTCWMLFDIRCMGGSIDSSSNTAVVHHVPLSTDSNALPCKGMATDPMQSVVIIPFQRKHSLSSSDDDQYGVNVWSLDSGGYMGHKTITTHSKPILGRHQRRILPLPSSDVELCSTITPAWSITKPSHVEQRMGNVPTNDTDDPDFSISSKSSYGLWLQLVGRYGMYHITCPGRWTPSNS